MGQTIDRYARQVLAFGPEGQVRIRGTRTAIVGLGGTGCHVAQQLAHLGVGSITLVDDDRVETSNLNRLVGATPRDERAREAKVEVARRHIAAIDDSIQIHCVPRDLRTKVALRRLITGPDVIFGCVDNDGARYVLTLLSAAYSKVLVDLASEIDASEGHVRDFGGRVIVARPGDFCLVCAQAIDLETAKVELEGPEERAFRKEHGYGLGPQAPSPAVISLNATIAGLAVTEFVMLVTGLRDPKRMLTYKGMRGVVTVSIDTKRDGCRICEGLAGRTDAADIMRFAAQ